MCSTCKEWKLTLKRIVSKQVFDAIKYPLIVGALKKFVIDRSKAQRKWNSELARICHVFPTFNRVQIIPRAQVEHRRPIRPVYPHVIST